MLAAQTGCGGRDAEPWTTYRSSKERLQCGRQGPDVREAKVASEPEALLAVLTSGGHHFKRIGLEAGPLSQWLFSALGEAGLPVICVETRHMRAVLQAQNQQDGPQQHPRHGADDAGGALSPGACEDVT